MDENIEWYYAKDGQQCGPASESEVCDLIKTKIIGPGDSVWNENMDQWIPSKDVKNFEHLFKNQTKKLPPPLPITGSKPAYMPSMWIDEGIDTPTPELWNNLLFKLSTIMFIILVGFLFILIISAPNNPSDGLKSFITLVVIFVLLGSIISSTISLLLINRKYNWWLRFGKWQLIGEDDYTLEFIDNLNCKLKQNLYTYRVSENCKFICIYNGIDKIIEWKIVKHKFLSSFELELVDQTGKIFSFKIDSPMIEYNQKQINLYKTIFNTKRIRNLMGGWISVAGNVKGIEFTSDDTAIFADGTVGKYAITGEEPNEVIEILMLDGSKKLFQVISLTATQLVISENNEPTTLRRPEKNITNENENSVAKKSLIKKTSKTDQEVNIIDDPNKRNQPEPPPKGFWGTVSSLLFNYTCPNCKQRSGNEIKQYTVKEGQRWENLYDREEKRNKPKPVNYWITEHVYLCKECQHQWIAHYNHRSEA